ncbi:MAG: PPOX class F420-dependent oxidoreductase [Rubrobacteraceae bacterium]
MVAETDEGLHPVAAELAGRPNYAAFTTLMPDGRPQTQITWVDAAGKYVLVNTETGHQKFRNARRDPRVTVTVWDANNPYRYAEIRGEVVEVVTGAEAREHIDKLSIKYHGGPYGRPIRSERVMLKISPRRQVVNDPRSG